VVLGQPIDVEVAHGLMLLARSVLLSAQPAPA
jgi:hypothetical protein